jgi:hypothetical protein
MKRNLRKNNENERKIQRTRKFEMHLYEYERKKLLLN